MVCKTADDKLPPKKNQKPARLNCANSCTGSLTLYSNHLSTPCLMLVPSPCTLLNSVRLSDISVKNLFRDACSEPIKPKFNIPLTKSPSKPFTPPISCLPVTKVSNPAIFGLAFEPSCDFISLRTSANFCCVVSDKYCDALSMLFNSLPNICRSCGKFIFSISSIVTLSISAYSSLNLCLTSANCVSLVAGLRSASICS